MCQLTCLSVCFTLFVVSSMLRFLLDVLWFFNIIPLYILFHISSLIYHYCRWRQLPFLYASWLITFWTGDTFGDSFGSSFHDKEWYAITTVLNILDFKVVRVRLYFQWPPLAVIGSVRQRLNCMIFIDHWGLDCINSSKSVSQLFNCMPCADI